MAKVVLQSTPEVLLNESFYKPPGLFSIAELCGDPEEQASRNEISHSYWENRFRSIEGQRLAVCCYAAAAWSVCVCRELRGGG